MKNKIYYMIYLDPELNIDSFIGCGYDDKKQFLDHANKVIKIKYIISIRKAKLNRKEKLLFNEMQKLKGVKV